MSYDYAQYFREVDAQTWSFASFQAYFKLKITPNPKFAEKTEEQQAHEVKCHYIRIIRQISEGHVDYKEFPEVARNHAVRQLKIHRAGRPKRRRRGHGDRSSDSERSGSESTRPQELNINLGQLNVGIHNGDNNFTRISREAANPIAQNFANNHACSSPIDRRVHTESIPELSVSSSGSNQHEALVSNNNLDESQHKNSYVPRSEVERESPSRTLASYQQLLPRSSPQSSLAPTLLLTDDECDSATGLALDWAACPSKKFMIEQDTTLKLDCGGTLQERMMNFLDQHVADPGFIEYGIIDLADKKVRDELGSRVCYELSNKIIKLPESDSDFKDIVAGNVHTSSLSKWYSDAVSQCLEYPLRIVQQGDWWRHCRFWDFVDHLFASSDRISRRKPTLHLPFAEREAGSYQTWELYDIKHQLPLAYLEHQLERTTPHHSYVYYLSRGLFDTYRSRLGPFANEMVTFAIVMTANQIFVYKFSPLTRFFVVANSYENTIGPAAVADILALVYRLKLQLDHSIRIFDKALNNMVSL